MLKRMKNWNNVKLKHDLAWILNAHILTTQAMLFIIKELTYPVLHIKYLITSLLMAQSHHTRRLSKFILLTKQPLLWRRPPKFKSMYVSKIGRQLNNECHQMLKFSSHQILVTYRNSNSQLLSIKNYFLEAKKQNFVNASNLEQLK